MANLQPEEVLSQFGFTDFESVLYSALVRQSPLSGYKLAQIVGKAPANTYQSLRSLMQKGAVIACEGTGEGPKEATTYRAVPPDELMAVLSQAFESRRKIALDVLNEVHTPPEEQHIYQLQNVAQVLERARTMIDTAHEIVLFDLFPGIYEHLETNINAARNRGVVVAGITYEAKYASLYTPYNGEVATELSAFWPGLGMIIVADGAQELIAQLSTDMRSLLNGVWSDSAFLSATYHSALAAEIRLTAMRLDPSDPLKMISLMRSKPPGLRKIYDQKPRKKKSPD